MPDVLQDQKDKDQKLQDLLSQYSGERNESLDEKVIYGIYDNSNQPLSVRINDWLIDHSKVSLKDKAYFFHLLAVMLDAGIPLLQSLHILQRREKNQRFKRVIATLHHAVSTGKTLSDSMARFPDVFSDVEVGVVRSGEAVGRMNDMLIRLSTQLDKNHELQMKLYSAAIYPTSVLTTLIIVGIAMMIWVIPNLLRILSDSGLPESEYPLPTVILVAATNILQGYWWAIIIGIILLVGIFQVYTHTTTGKFKWDYFKLKIPVVGTMLRKVYVLQFIRLLGILVTSGLPVTKTLQIIATSLENELYTLKTWNILAKVQQGQPISNSIQASPFLFPDTVSHMLSIAEKTAAIGPISEKIGDHYDREIDHSLRRLTALFEPLMIVVVALAVALLALAVLLPIFKLTQIV